MARTFRPLIQDIQKLIVQVDERRSDAETPDALFLTQARITLRECELVLSAIDKMVQERKKERERL